MGTLVQPIQLAVCYILRDLGKYRAAEAPAKLRLGGQEPPASLQAHKRSSLPPKTPQGS